MAEVAGLQSRQVMDIVWLMSIIQFESAEAPLDRSGVAPAAAQALGRAEAMGLLSRATPIRRLDMPTLLRLIREVARASNVGRDVLSTLSSPHPSPEQISRALHRLSDELEQSPVPEREWHSLISTLGYELLTRLVGVSEASVRRYAARERATPDEVADRLHFLALVVADLAGSYNEFGIRRWFQRTRPQLRGKSVEQLLRGEWRSDNPDAQRIRDLARALTGELAT